VTAAECSVDDVRTALEGAAPAGPEGVVVRETHSSWVFLAGDRAYKLKKPIVLPFLDYGTPQRRREMCREEVRLNRRLAPDVYLGVRALAATAEGVELAPEDDPRAVDYVVEMRRYDERCTLASWLTSGELRRIDIVALAALLARFHRDAERVSSLAPPLAVERRVTANFHELLPLVDQRCEIGRVLALERFVHAFVVAHGHLLAERSRDGLIRECHGDLRAEHVLLESGGLQIVDCIEFDRGLRELDVADDLAFLLMDLAAHRAEHYAELLLDAYRAAGGPPADDALIAFYAVYRALVRAKVALVHAGQHPRATRELAHDHAAARDLIALAERFAWQARLPLVIVVCGVPGTGKSHLAHAICEASGMAHLSSDVTRKRLAGLAPDAHAPAARYTAEFSRMTYAELARRASAAVAARRGVIVDATFRRRADRDAFAESLTAEAPVLFVECRAPLSVLTARAALRRHDPASVSDATPQVVRREYARWEPLDEVPPSSHLVVRTDRPVEAIVREVVGLLDERMGQLAARAVPQV
jgi:aminoglycoside phosphotransferase family enzyme/predicted kinase